jgi:predicted transcriptional regulator of viral defense system
VVTTAELVAAGLTDAKIRILVRRGVLEPIWRGIYADAGKAADLIRDDPARERLLYVAAAVAMEGSGAVASHEDAALAHGLALLDRPPVGLYSVSLPVSRTRGRRRRPGIHVHSAALPPQHVTVRDGLPVTTVARTVIDLARVLPFKSGVVVADSALSGFYTYKAELEAVIRYCSRWPGIDTARRVVDFSDPLAESAFESIARVAFRDGGLPPPMLQVWIKGAERMVGRVDFLWYKQATIAEADGAIKYADPDRAKQQLRRDAELRRAGYEVVHFTWRDLAAAPDQVIAWIRAAFGRAARLQTVQRRADRRGA